MNRVLIVDDDPVIRDLIALGLQEAGIQSSLAGTGREALAALDERPVAVILDLGLPDISGLDVLAAIRKFDEGIPVIVVTATEDVATAVECMRLGAHDFLQKPFESARVVTTVKNACTQRKMSNRLDTVGRERRKELGFQTLQGESTVLVQILESLERAVSRDISILIQGESGTGKEVLARAIHAESNRSAGPFIPVNCGAIPESLIESELFGHDKGAFTGAHACRPGLFEQAEGGVIFLDEIGELRVDLQVRLLRVLQERVVKRVGSNHERVVDVRVIAASNRNLQSEAAAGRFREDLYYRIAVFPVTLPPLRDRGRDVLLLAEYFLAQCCEQTRMRFDGFDPMAERALLAYDWPGNVRQLQNVIERAVILADGKLIAIEDLSDEVLCSLHEDQSASDDSVAAPNQIITHKSDIRTLAEIERAAILEALELTGWNVRETAGRLGIGRATLYRRLHQYGLDRTGPIGRAAGEING